MSGRKITIKQKSETTKQILFVSFRTFAFS